MHEKPEGLSDDHYFSLLEDIKYGRLVPVLGGDINLCGRPQQGGAPIGWRDGGDIKYPPSACELAIYLLTETINKSGDLFPKEFSRLVDEQMQQHTKRMSLIGLANVYQYLQLFNPSIVNDTLPRLVGENYQPTPVHKFLVKLAQYQPDSTIADNPPHPCIVTTCFDQVLEQQFDANHIPYHLVAYVLGQQGGGFAYTPPTGGRSVPLKDLSTEQQNDLMKGLKEHAVIVKLNGGVKDVANKFAITEDHYIDYMTHQGVGDSLPEILLAKLVKRTSGNSHLLFMGYGLCHWNLRVILRRMWSEQLANAKNRNWTIVKDYCTNQIDQKFCTEYGLLPKELITVDSLETYINHLTQRMSNELMETSQTNTRTIGELTAISQKPERDQIFISYSHEDEKWLKMLKKMLAPVLGEKLRTWDDSAIKPGVKWQEDIRIALLSAKAAVLLVSEDFLDSEFIMKNELPPLLKAAEEGSCKILWIKVNECMVDCTAIWEYQALYKGDAFISLSESGLNKTLNKIARDLVKINEEIPPESQQPEA